MLFVQEQSKHINNKHDLLVRLYDELFNPGRHGHGPSKLGKEQ